MPTLDELGHCVMLAHIVKALAPMHMTLLVLRGLFWKLHARSLHTSQQRFMPSSTGSQYFWIVLTGQFISSTSNALFFGGGSLLSEIWFPSSERALSTAIAGGISPQLGILLALGLTPVFIQSPLTETVCNTSMVVSETNRTAWNSAIYQRIFYYQLVVATVAVLTFLLTVLSAFVVKTLP